MIMFATHKLIPYVKLDGPEVHDNKVRIGSQDNDIGQKALRGGLWERKQRGDKPSYIQDKLPLRQPLLWPCSGSRCSQVLTWLGLVMDR